MPKQTTIQPHLTLEELETNYRKAADPVERSQWHIIWLLAQSRKVSEVVEITAYSPGWIRELARRPNHNGPQALGDKRRDLPGVPPLLSPELQSELAEAVQQTHSDGGLWSGPKVTEWIEANTGRKVRRQRGWEDLTKLNFTLQQPRPHHTKADEATQEEFKKTPQQVEELRVAHPKAKVEVWSFDEHRLGLQPILRKVWSPRGKRPVVKVEQRYQWLYLYGFVQPQNGQTFWLLLPFVNTAVFNLALREFARDVGAGVNKEIVLVIDGAGWQTSREVEVPAGIHLI